jgi:hypothetical protein
MIAYIALAASFVGFVYTFKNKELLTEQNDVGTWERARVRIVAINSVVLLLYAVMRLS